MHEYPLRIYKHKGDKILDRVHSTYNGFLMIYAGVGNLVKQIDELDIYNEAVLFSMSFESIITWSLLIPQNIYTKVRNDFYFWK